MRSGASREDVGAAGAHQVAAVLRGGEPAVADPDDPREGPLAHVVTGLADQRLVTGVAGPAPAAHRDPVPGDRHPHDELRQRPVGDQPEQHALQRARVQPPASHAAAGRGGDAQLLPQPVQDIGAAHRDRRHELPASRGRGLQGRAGLQQPRQRRDQPGDRLAVQLVLAAEVVQHPGARPLCSSANSWPTSTSEGIDPPRSSQTRRKRRAHAIYR
jgi:hypothetical protein